MLNFGCGLNANKFSLPIPPQNENNFLKCTDKISSLPIHRAWTLREVKLMNNKRVKKWTARREKFAVHNKKFIVCVYANEANNVRETTYKGLRKLRLIKTHHSAQKKSHWISIRLPSGANLLIKWGSKWQKYLHQKLSKFLQRKGKNKQNEGKSGKKFFHK